MTREDNEMVRENVKKLHERYIYIDKHEHVI